MVRQLLMEADGFCVVKWWYGEHSPAGEPAHTKTRFLPQWTVRGAMNVGCEGVALCSSQLCFLKSVTFASCLNSELQHRKVSQGQNKETWLRMLSS